MWNVCVMPAGFGEWGWGRVGHHSDRQMIGWIRSPYWGVCREGLSGPLGWPCAICVYSDSWLVLIMVVCGFCWIGIGGTHCSPNRTGRCKEPRKHLFVCFLRRTRVGFVDSLARQVAARTAAARCGVGPKVMFPAGQSLRVDAG